MKPCSRSSTTSWISPRSRPASWSSSFLPSTSGWRSKKSTKCWLPRPRSVSSIWFSNTRPTVPRHFIGDAGRIRQVVTNLVGNAVKFSSDGCVLITVECQGQDAQQARMRVSVQDNGPGIPQEKLDLLFGKFSQVDASTTRKYGGTGLGLAISKQLVELMGGSIGVESRPGEGSHLLVHPAVDPGCPAPRGPRSGGRPERLARAHRGRQRSEPASAA